MPKVHNLAAKCRTKMVFPSNNSEVCRCEESNLPPWTGEMHGLSQALLSKSLKMRIFWWIVMGVCIGCGSTTTIMVITEYLNGPTATSTTIRLVNSLQLPSISLCPKVPDALNALGLLADIRHAIPGLSDDECLDLVRFWIGGYGLENMDSLPSFNTSYIRKLNSYFQIWSSGYTVDEFFEITQAKYGLVCEELFYSCELGGVTYDCCNDLFVRKLIMRRGICFTIRPGVNQSESDDMGRLALSLKAPPSITTARSNYVQDQIIVYVTDNYEKINDFPRFYLYPNEWNRMRFTARFLELLEQPGVCTNRIFGKNAECTIRRWLLTNIVNQYNCTLLYLNISGISVSNPCEPLLLASNYYRAIQLVSTSNAEKETCVPGCRRWDYQITLQQSRTLGAFEDYRFNLEVSFNDLQYEHVKEVYTVSVPGLMSQIGGQFGFFLGLSIITFIQMILYAIHYCVKISYKKTHRYIRSISEIRSRTGSVHPRNSFAVSAIQSKMFAEQANASGYCTPRRQSIIQLNSRLLIDDDDDYYQRTIKHYEHNTIAEETTTPPPPPPNDDDKSTIASDTNSCASICNIDAANLTYIPDFVIDNCTTNYRTNKQCKNIGRQMCKNCNLIKRKYFNEKLFKGDVTFAYRNRWIYGIQRAISDRLLTSTTKAAEATAATAATAAAAAANELSDQRSTNIAATYPRTHFFD